MAFGDIVAAECPRCNDQGVVKVEFDAELFSWLLCNVRDGDGGLVVIDFCPWCGVDLSKEGLQ